MEIDDIIEKFHKNYGRLDNDLENDISAIGSAIYDILEYLKERLPIDEKEPEK